MYPTGAKLNTPDHRDIPLTMIQAVAPTPARFVSDFGSVVPVYDQRQLGICVGMAEGEIREYNIFRTTGKHIPISKRYIYDLARLYSGQKPEDGEGTQPRAAGLSTLHAGCATTNTVKDDLSLSHKDFATITITEEIINDALPNKSEGLTFVENDALKIRNAIFQNGAISVTIRVRSNWYYYSSGLLKNIGSEEGFHRVVLYGFDFVGGRLVLIGRNSWSENWGMKGDFMIDYEEYKADIYDLQAYVDVPAGILEAVRGFTIRPQYTFSKNLYYGMKNDADVRALQDVLKYEGTLESGIESTGNYLDKTAVGVDKFQKRYALASWMDLLGLKGYYVRQVTITKLNSLYRPMISNKIVTFAKAIQKHEGYFAPGENKNFPNGSLSWRNRNPGNFRYTSFIVSLGATGKDEVNNFAIFPTYEKGFSALCEFLKAACNNKLQSYKGYMSLYDFFSVYAPSSDNNNPRQYAEAVAQAIGVSPDTPINKLI